MRTSLLPAAAMAMAFSASALSVAARDAASARSIPHRAEPATSIECLPLDRYNEAVDTTLHSTDWDRIPDSSKVQHGTRSLMSEFLVFKEMQARGERPCPDLAAVHSEFTSATAPVRIAPTPDTARSRTKSTQRSTAAKPTATVVGNAWVRKEPSRSAQPVRIAKKGETLAVFGAEHGWISVGTRKSEGWVIASMLKQ
jgi:hypothetical protein